MSALLTHKDLLNWMNDCLIAADPNYKSNSSVLAIPRTDEMIDDLIEQLRRQSVYGAKIDIEEYNVTDPNLDPPPGILIAYEQPRRYVILLKPSLDKNFRRYVLIKEIVQILLSELHECKGGESLDMISLIDEFYTDVLTIHSNPYNIDMVAHVGAMQILLPYSVRLWHNDKATRTGNPVDYKAISEAYGLPLHMVEDFMSESTMRILKAHFV